MTRMKAIGLTLVAVFALSALVASAAQATPKFTSSGTYPAKGEGGQKTPHVFTVQGQPVECSTAKFVATLPKEESMSTSTAKYEGCKAFGFLNATVEMNGCEYTFTVEATTPEKTIDDYQGSVHIVCPPEKEITVVAATCTVHIPEQTPTVPTVHYHVTTGTPNKIDVESKVEGVHSKVTSGFLCPLEASATDTTGKYTGTTELVGNGGTSVDIAME